MSKGSSYEITYGQRAGEAGGTQKAAKTSPCDGADANPRLSHAPHHDLAVLSQFRTACASGIPGRRAGCP